jgi:hypothetical protein
LRISLREGLISFIVIMEVSMLKNICNNFVPEVGKRYPTYSALHTTAEQCCREKELNTERDGKLHATVEIIGSEAMR